ncbi:MAG: hypothetical protein ACI9S8_002246 [Chlamydiales bacterium]|jgi:hypothetical protein
MPYYSLQPMAAPHDFLHIQQAQASAAPITYTQACPAVSRLTYQPTHYMSPSVRAAPPAFTASPMAMQPRISPTRVSYPYFAQTRLPTPQPVVNPHVAKISEIQNSICAIQNSPEGISGTNLQRINELSAKIADHQSKCYSAREYGQGDVYRQIQESFQYVVNSLATLIQLPPRATTYQAAPIYVQAVDPEPSCMYRTFSEASTSVRSPTETPPQSPAVNPTRTQYASASTANTPMDKAIAVLQNRGIAIQRQEWLTGFNGGQNDGIAKIHTNQGVFFLKILKQDSRTAETITRLKTLKSRLPEILKHGSNRQGLPQIVHPIAADDNWVLLPGAKGLCVNELINDRNISVEEQQEIVRQVSQSLEKLDDLGWRHGDANTMNIFYDRNSRSVHLIDNDCLYDQRQGNGFRIPKKDPDGFRESLKIVGKGHLIQQAPALPTCVGEIYERVVPAHNPYLINRSASNYAVSERALKSLALYGRAGSSPVPIN